MKPDREMLKGSTPILILAILADEPRHGYAVAREIERRSGGAISLGEGSLYPMLHSLEREALIQGSWEQPPGGGSSKKVYVITEHGKAELARQTRSWRDLTDAIERVIQSGGKPDAQPA